MEPISFTLALAGIPGIFTACVDCYQYIQLGREFEDDFEKTWSRLEASEVRLTRWGAAMGIDGPEAKLRSDGYSEDDIKMTYHWLREIKNAFDSAIETSIKYGKTAKPDKLQVLDTKTHLDQGSDALRTLHQHMRSVVDQRIKPRKRDRIAWAFYRKGAFQNLIETIADLTNNLIELFPSTLEKQKQLCQREVGELDIASLALLDKAIRDDDETLKTVLRTEVQQRSDLWSNIEVRNYFRGHFGHNVAQGESAPRSVYTKITAGGHAFAHFGNNIGDYKGKTVYDVPEETRQ